MNDKMISGIVTVVVAVVGVAALAVLLSGEAQTAGVLKKLFGSIGQFLCVAMSPITGGGCQSDVSSTITFGDIVG